MSTRSLIDDDISGIFDPKPSRPATEPVKAVEFTSLQDPMMVERAEAYTDGGCRGNPGPAGYGVVIRLRGKTIERTGTLPKATNNEAEYAGLLACLRWAVAEKVPDLIINMDSELVVRQMQGRYSVNSKLRPLYLEACQLLLQLGTVTFMHVHREYNTHADRLATQAMDAAGFPRENRKWTNRPRLKP